MSIPGHGSWQDGQPDARSEAAAILWEMLAVDMNKAPSAAAEILLKYLNGELNRIPKVARDAVRNQIQTERRRRDQLEYSNDKTELEVETAAATNPGFESTTRKILLEQIFAKANLTDNEKKVVVEVGLNVRTQQDLARELGISQTAVSRVRKRALDKLSRAARPPQ